MFPKYPLRIIFHFFKLKIQEIVNPDKFISEDNIDSDPFKQFDKWYKEAIRSRITFYEAMTLSTADKKGRPSCRLVLLKAYDKNGFIFFSNSNSRKGKELNENPFAALTFFWNKLGKQVRIEGKIEVIQDADSDEYFSTRPELSRLGAWASEQSSIIPDRNYFLNKVEELRNFYKGKIIPRPPYWIGYRLIPDQIEFWQNRTNRLHDRFLFTIQNSNEWKYVRLSP
ncbi:MAG: pyridoxamine 5'-phosphate oxidase [Ignavibacteria bacterium]|nr:pyridoxamine 5'-phosphate oxidase [Ignavibacteria bacterium]